MTTNTFESGARKVIPAVLIYVQTGDLTLMIHRTDSSFHHGKWNGLGGKLEADESAVEAAKRELKEESGLDLPLPSFKLLGVAHFPNFKPHRSEDWMVFVFVAQLPEGVSPSSMISNAEGELHWIRTEDLLTLHTWPGDRHFLSFVQNRQLFSATIWYEDHLVKKFEITKFE